VCYLRFVLRGSLSHLAYQIMFSTLKMDAIRSSEMLVIPRPLSLTPNDHSSVHELVLEGAVRKNYLAHIHLLLLHVSHFKLSAII
jgi:hypothetical protein